MEGGERKATLYPGNVVRMSWQVDRFVVVAARVFTTDGQPLADARLEESTANIVTNTQGRFQAEVTHLQQMHFTTNKNQHCSVNLPTIKPVNGVLLYKQPLVCVP